MAMRLDKRVNLLIANRHQQGVLSLARVGYTLESPRVILFILITSVYLNKLFVKFNIFSVY